MVIIKITEKNNKKLYLYEHKHISYTSNRIYRIEY